MRVIWDAVKKPEFYPETSGTQYQDEFMPT